MRAAQVNRIVSLLTAAALLPGLMPGMLQQVGAPGKDQAIEALTAIGGKAGLVDGHQFGQLGTAVKNFR